MVKNPVYFRLINKDGYFVGFKRVITEYLQAGGDRWRLDPVEHDAGESQRLSRPAVGIMSLKRAKLSSKDNRSEVDEQEEEAGVWLEEDAEPDREVVPPKGENVRKMGLSVFQPMDGTQVGDDPEQRAD